MGQRVPNAVYWLPSEMETSLPLDESPGRWSMGLPFVAGSNFQLDDSVQESGSRPVNWLGTPEGSQRIATGQAGPVNRNCLHALSSSLFSAY